MSDTLQTILSRAELQYSTQNGDGDFLSALLQQTVTELKPDRLCVWIRNSRNSHRIAESGNSDRPSPSADEMSAVHSGGIRLLPSDQSDTASSGRQMLAASSVAADSELVLEFVEGRQGVEEEVLVQLADVFADLQRRRLLDSMLESSRRESAWQALTAQVHGSLDSSVIANIVATDTAAVLPCQRISVGRKRGRHWDVVATTGVSQPNPRSDASRQITSWIESTATGNPPAGGDSPSVVRPLRPDGKWSGAEWAVVLEAADLTEEDRQLEQFLQHVSIALANCTAARQYSPVGMLRSWLQLVRRPRALITTGILAAAIAALILVPTSLRVEVYGELVPKERAFVFAPDDGTITELHVEEDTEVAEQGLLCVLTNEDLNVQAETIDGELAAANARLAAIEALRGSRRNENTDAGLLSAERAELVEKVKSLTKQSEIVTKRLNQLTVTARMKGRIYGDRLRQTLLLRPVQRGQFLLEIADPAAGWQLHLRIPEAEIRYVLTALQEQQSELAISYALETSPEVTRQATLTSLGEATDVDRRGDLSTLAIARPLETDFSDERPGAGVVARIHCGQRAAGFVWFRRIIEFVQRQF